MVMMCTAYVGPLGAFVPIKQMRLLLLADIVPHHSTQLYKAVWTLTFTCQVGCIAVYSNEPSPPDTWYAKQFPKHQSSRYWWSCPDAHAILESLMLSPQKSAHIFCDGPDSPCSRICGLCALCCTYALWSCSANAAPASTETNGSGRVPIKLYYKNSWWAGHCPTPAPAHAWMPLRTGNAPSPKVAFSIFRELIFLRNEMTSVSLPSLF